ncbi:NUDIX domain-containing protein [Candidatus Woesearchaeota archaeon]|nr:NUDIX domain-containing protein [Candidatus Woesearchaeota archaeon]
MKEVVNALLFDENDNILIVKRNSKTGYGMLSIPGGKIERGETQRDAVIREIKEETDLEIKALQFFDEVHYKNEDLKIYLYLAHAQGDIKLDKRELSDYYYMKVDKIKSNRVFSPDKDAITKLKKQLIDYIKVKNQLQQLTGKKYILFTDRGNTSIKLSLNSAKQKNKNKAFIQDQGGWLTYPQFAKKLKFEVIRLKTDYGIVSLSGLDVLDSSFTLLINSMPGYIAEQKNMKKIQEICIKKRSFLINDVSGSIGSEIAKYGDIIIGSFGRWKPVNVKYGGFIATDNLSDYLFMMNTNTRKIDMFYSELNQKLANLTKRRKFFYQKNFKIKKELINQKIIHRKNKGFNVIVKDNKKKIIEYCKKNNYEYTLCPRYIRVLEDAVSIEVKRLEVS